MLSVDPGLRGCGAALFRFDEPPGLVAAAYVPGHDEPESAETVVRTALAVERWVREQHARGRIAFRPCEVAVEWPVAYARERKANTKDLPALVGVSMAVCALFPEGSWTRYYPDEWKGGSYPRDGIEPRVRSRLTAEERARCDLSGVKKANVADVWAAVGVGLHHLGRFERRRAYPRGQALEG